MSSVQPAIVNPDSKNATNEAIGQGQPARNAQHKNYKGFVAGVFSGISKLSVGHPYVYDTALKKLCFSMELTYLSFDTIKVRLQTSEKLQFKGPLDCLLQTIRHEGVRGLYKGATPPLVGWMFMDSIMLGSLTFYRRILKDNVFSNPSILAISRTSSRQFGNAKQQVQERLPTVGHGLAGILAGATVSFIAAPVEHIKARLQVQYAADKSKRLYSGPIDCVKRIARAHGIRGLYHGLSATLLFRSFFFFWWGSYDLFTRYFSDHTRLSTPAINFWAGGLSAQVFWLTSYPADVVKQRIMTDPLGGALRDGQRRFPRWKDAAMEIWRRDGPRGFWRGFLPCFLRAFPANAVALAAFEGVMRGLPE